MISFHFRQAKDPFPWQKSTRIHSRSSLQKANLKVRLMNSPYWWIIMKYVWVSNFILRPYIELSSLYLIAKIKMIFYLQLPLDFSFAQTIDIYFKIHEIFGIKFDERLQFAMFYLKHYVYKMKEGNRKPSTKLIELHNHLSSIALDSHPEMNE